jgi:outer membrane immunogenic protein
LNILMGDNMKYAFSAALAAALGFSGVVYGASLKDAPIYESPMLWSGFYIGIQGGYADGDGDLDVTSDSYLEVRRGFGIRSFQGWDEGSSDGDGFFAGAHIGVNRQDGHIVYGLQADLNWSSLDSGTAQAFSLAPRGDEGDEVAGFTSAKSEVKWYGTVTGRVGIAHGPLLAYVMGGLAYGNVKLDGVVTLASSFDEGDDLRFATASLSEDETKLGYTLGAGVDYAVDQNVVLGFAYKYVDLGKVSTSAALDEFRGPFGQGFYDLAEVGGTAKADVSFHTYELRLSVKLGDVD